MILKKEEQMSAGKLKEADSLDPVFGSRTAAKLNELKLHERAVIAPAQADPAEDEQHTAMRTRLSVLGFSEGSTVQCVSVSPLGDPRAYSIRGAVIALRCEDAALVEIAQL